MLSRGTAYEKSRRCSSVDPTPIMNLPVKLVSGAAYLSLSIGPCVCYASKPNASECTRLSRHQLRRCVPQQRERHDQVWIYWSDGASLTLALAVPAAAGDVQNSPRTAPNPKRGPWSLIPMSNQTCRSKTPCAGATPRDISIIPPALAVSMGTADILATISNRNYPPGGELAAEGVLPLSWRVSRK